MKNLKRFKGLFDIEFTINMDKGFEYNHAAIKTWAWKNLPEPSNQVQEVIIEDRRICLLTGQEYWDQVFDQVDIEVL